MITKYTLKNRNIIEVSDDTANIFIYTKPNENDLLLLKHEFNLDDYDIASVVDQDEVPRIEMLEKRLLIIWKIPASVTAIDSLELEIKVVGLVFRDGHLGMILDSGDVRFSEREFRLVENVHDVILAYMLRTIRHFVSHLKVIRQVAADLEKKITKSMENKHLLQMFMLAEGLVYYLDALEGNYALLNRLKINGSQYGLNPKQLELLDDIILENAQAVRQAHIFSDVLSGLMDARGTIVNNNMNVLLKNLTLINTVFLPLNLIASIGGMSEWSMMTQPMKWQVSYALFSLGMIGLGWGTWIVMKRFVDKPPS